MKIITKLAAAALLAVSVAAPALALDPEALTLEERSVAIQQTRQVRATDAMAYAPAVPAPAIVDPDLSIASQR
jgi:hypothetical protein